VWWAGHPPKLRSSVVILFFSRRGLAQRGREMGKVRRLHVVILFFSRRGLALPGGASRRRPSGPVVILFFSRRGLARTLGRRGNGQRRMVVILFFSRRGLAQVPEVEESRESGGSRNPLLFEAGFGSLARAPGGPGGGGSRNPLLFEAGFGSQCLGIWASSAHIVVILFFSRRGLAQIEEFLRQLPTPGVVILFFSRRGLAP